MALNITGKKLTLKGTPINLDSIYARIGVFLPANGTMLVEVSTYHSQEAYKAGEPIISINEIPHGTTQHPLSKGDQLLAAHNLVKANLEEQGYTVSISDL